MAIDSEFSVGFGLPVATGALQTAFLPIFVIGYHMHEHQKKKPENQPGAFYPFKQMETTKLAHFFIPAQVFTDSCV